METLKESKSAKHGIQLREHYLLESCPIFRIQHIKAFMDLSGPF